jgi:hypothetical protein
MPYSFRDYRNEEIDLSDEVYRVILDKHPESKQFISRISQTLAVPDQVRKSVTDSRVRLYYRFYDDVLNGKFVTVVVKRADRSFISTIYATDKIKEGELLWPI